MEHVFLDPVWFGYNCCLLNLNYSRLGKKAPFGGLSLKRGFPGLFEPRHPHPRLIFYLTLFYQSLFCNVNCKMVIVSPSFLSQFHPFFTQALFVRCKLYSVERGRRTKTFHIINTAFVSPGFFPGLTPFLHKPFCNM